MILIIICGLHLNEICCVNTLNIMANQKSNLKQKHNVWMQKLRGQEAIINDHLKKIEHYSDHPNSPYGDYADELQEILNKKLQKVNRVVNLIEHEDQLVDENRTASELEISYELIDKLMNELDNNFEALEKWFTKIDDKETTSINL